MAKEGNNIELEVIELNEIGDTPEARRGKTLNLLWFVMYIVCILSICLVIVTFIVQRSVVEGSSMETTLSEGDSVLVNKLSYLFGSPKRFDVIVFKYDNGNNINYVKRVIGLPGDTIQIVNGIVYIDGQRLEDDTYCQAIISDPGVAANPIKLGDDEYFVLGDNRNSSSDSRYGDVGMIHKDQIIGKVFLRIWPLGSFGGVK